MIICVYNSGYGTVRVGIGESAEEAYSDMLGNEDENEYPLDDCDFYEGDKIKVTTTRVWHVEKTVTTV